VARFSGSRLGFSVEKWAEKRPTLSLDAKASWPSGAIGQKIDVARLVLLLGGEKASCESNLAAQRLAWARKMQLLHLLLSSSEK